MADYDIITDLYRITGLRGIGSGYVFPKTRVVKKVKKRSEKEEEEENEPPKSSEKKSKGIDIEA
ncbi:MAG: hypothetical protein HQL09_00440 [Nitrospirae bacterium]|nr:hypothetical protein [Nitrospirota bacterium]